MSGPPPSASQQVRARATIDDEYDRVNKRRILVCVCDKKNPQTLGLAL